MRYIPGIYFTFDPVAISMIIWNTNLLATSLAARRVTSDDKFRYLLYSSCMFAIAGYIGYLFLSQPNGWIFWYEAALVLIVTYFGLLRCREAYEEATDDRLLENVMILGFPLGIKLIAFTWIAHSLVGWGYPRLVSHLTLTDESSLFPAVIFLLTAISKFYSFLIGAIGTALYYWRLSIHLKTVASTAERGT